MRGVFKQSLTPLGNSVIQSCALANKKMTCFSRSSFQLDIAHALPSECVEMKVAASRDIALTAGSTTLLETGVFHLSLYLGVL